MDIFKRYYDDIISFNDNINSFNMLYIEDLIMSYINEYKNTLIQYMGDYLIKYFDTDAITISDSTIIGATSEGDFLIKTHINGKASILTIPHKPEDFRSHILSNDLVIEFIGCGDECRNELLKVYKYIWIVDDTGTHVHENTYVTIDDDMNIIWLK